MIQTLKSENENPLEMEFNDKTNIITLKKEGEIVHMGEFDNDISDLFYTALQRWSLKYTNHPLCVEE